MCSSNLPRGPSASIGKTRIGLSPTGTGFGIKDKEGEDVLVAAAGRPFKPDIGSTSAPPGIDEPPSRQGKSQELAIQQATAEERKRLALLGFRRFVLTSGRGLTTPATLGRKALLGR